MSYRQAHLMSLALLGCSFVAISIQPVQCVAGDLVADEPENQQEASLIMAFELPKMFDFEEYKKLFKRTYHGLEEMVRRKLMLARALRVWISSLKYKYRQSSFYLAINEFSDQTPEELQRMKNHQAKDDYESSADQRHHHPVNHYSKTEQLHVARLDVQPVEGDTNKLFNANGSEEKLRQKSPSREKRNVDDKKTRRRIENLQPIRQYKLTTGAELNETPESFSRRHSRRTREPDEVFLDHRHSGCLSLPRSQGDCGSCYAFASISMAEWLYCNQTGELVAFSEQYMIDCGSPHLVQGCYAGSRSKAAQFIHNYGLELRNEYPYRMEEFQCPYDDQTEPKAMGRIRMDIGAILIVQSTHFQSAIEYGPMYLVVSLGDQLYEYGGGVLGGFGCDEGKGHAVALIGHGREDGREYWLMRNSYGPSWGEGGHFKLSKGSNCIINAQGVLYGTSNLNDRVFEAKLNEMNDQTTVIRYNKYRG